MPSNLCQTNASLIIAHNPRLPMPVKDLECRCCAVLYRIMLYREKKCLVAKMAAPENAVPCPRSVRRIQWATCEKVYVVSL